ncbi:NADPH-dependent conjugated polyketone reductase C2 (CPR) (2-dehydropantolactone reductase) (2-dehydropantolactone reductase (A-specific)) (Ketopantoyl-lactone reductase) [Durusdinium trenchii]|uniref:NADPH-dependent conjugated polyketone reductase C2 (CPR) (2-dehydropantolactone reductase) (2-dehydropantolactone reductase (A-specific)) (Ketopantoyl-lactone reductase) n=1 Tax=Durusdinium trenchii TaxID=1381693 RepID=A0ABP0K3N6_9DINO
MARQGPRPYGPTLNERLSAAHARLMEVAQGGDSSPELKETSASPSSSKEETVTFGRKSVRLYIAWGKVQAVEEEADSNMRFWLGLSGPVVQRGFEVPVDEEELLQEKVGQIVVVVHGIGEKFAQRRWGGLVHDVGVLRRTLLHAQLKLCGFVQKDGRWQEGEDPVASGPKIEVLVSEWWQSVHSEEMDQQLSSITLPSLSAVRDFANLSLVDGLAFMQERSKVIAATSASIERTVARFKECHPQFKGQIFLLGHSLGGVISWDIIKEKRLSFTPSALFTLGSPLGVFLHTASGVQGKPSMDELGKVRFFNIFHPLDPVAYRMEPLLWPHGPCPPAPAQLNDRDACHAQRVDWALPLAALSSASELLQAVPSHISYYKNPDLGTFILRQCIRSPASTAQVATAARRLTASGPRTKKEAKTTSSSWRGSWWRGTVIPMKAPESWAGHVSSGAGELAGLPFLYGTAWKEGQTAELVVKAVRAGFRGIDTACQPKHYQEDLVGEALARLASEDHLPREQLWLQTKFTPIRGQDPRRVPYDTQAPLKKQVEQSIQKSLENLRTSYIDSLMMHSPMPTLEENLEVWGVFEQAVEAGHVRQLGISNCYDPRVFQMIYDAVRIKPKVLQNRFYADSGYDRELRAFCLENGVKYQTFWTLTANPHLLEMPPIRAAARRLSATPAQVLFAWLIRSGHQPLTGTKSLQHMKQDLQAANMALTEAEMRDIGGLFTGRFSSY